MYFNNIIDYRITNDRSKSNNNSYHTFTQNYIFIVKPDITKSMNNIQRKKNIKR